MTAIDFLMQKLINDYGMQISDDYLIIQEAKEMEKQQIINTYIIADSESTQEDSEHNALKFYERTYGSKGSDDHISDISKMVEVPQQETLYTEEQVREALKYGVDNSEIIKRGCKDIEGFIQSLKQPKKD